MKTDVEGQRIFPFLSRERKKERYRNLERKSGRAREREREKESVAEIDKESG